jgi:hypothetical protein
MLQIERGVIDMITVREEKNPPVTNVRLRVRSDWSPNPQLTMGIPHTGILAHAPSFSTSANPGCAMCGMPRPRFPGPDPWEVCVPSWPELNQCLVQCHRVIARDELCGSRRQAIDSWTSDPCARTEVPIQSHLEQMWESV